MVTFKPERIHQATSQHRKSKSKGPEAEGGQHSKTKIGGLEKGNSNENEHQGKTEG